MQVAIRLNVQKEIIWGLPGSKVILTTQTPAATFDTSLMTDTQKQSLYMAIKLGKVISTVPPELFFQSVAPKGAINTATVVPNIQMPKSLSELGIEAKDILDGNVSEIRKQILISSDLRLLRMLLALEASGKNRVTLTKLLTDQISQLEQKVIITSEKIESGPKPLLVDPAIIKLPGQKAVDYDVTEEVGESITLVYDKKKGAN